MTIAVLSCMISVDHEFEAFLYKNWDHSWIPPVGQEIEGGAEERMVVESIDVFADTGEIWVFLKYTKDNLTVGQAQLRVDQLVKAGWELQPNHNDYEYPDPFQRLNRDTANTDLEPGQKGFTP